MGSSSYDFKGLPLEIKEIINEAISLNHLIIVGEAHGASRAFQNYLKNINYSNVIVGHARKVRYNAGNWVEKKFGDTLQEREKNMIKFCDYTIIIWVNNSSVIAQNLNFLKKTGKPTFLYECSTKNSFKKFGTLDPYRDYFRRTF